MKTLALFTDSFPYTDIGNEYVFLANEVPVLAEHFKSIRIFPRFAGESPLELPGNCSIERRYSRFFASPPARLGSLVRTCWRSRLLSSECWRNAHQGPKGIVKIFGWHTTGVHVVEYLRWLNFFPDVLYSYWGNATTVGFTMWKQELPSCRTACRVHRYDVYNELQNPSFFPFREVCFPKLDQVHCVSRDAVGVLARQVPQANVCYSPLGVKKGKGRPQLPDSELIVCSCSTVSSVKRVDLIARSVCTFAAKQYRDIKWVHFGGGPSMEEVRRIVNERHPRNLKIELRGRTSNPEVREFYASNAVAVFVNLSQSEGVPVSMMEALSEGIPILATNVGGVSEIVNKTTGILLPQTTTPAEVAEGMARVVAEFNSRERRRTIVVQFQRYWNAETNFASFATKLCGNMKTNHTL